jgi:hypothetical protein
MTKKLVEVFMTVGLPPYTYVKPSYYGEVRADIEQSGKHLLIEGPSGIGKTCVVYKVFEELGWQKDVHYTYVTCREPGAYNVLEEFLAAARTDKPTKTPVLVVDDFHLIPASQRTTVGGWLKQVSDKAFQMASPPKAVLIGIPAAGMSLLSEAYDLGPRLGAYRLKRATDDEIRRLVSEGENALNVLFEDEDILLSEIEGNFWLGQYICMKVCASAGVTETCTDTRVLSFDLLTIRKRLMTELSPRYMPFAVTFSKGKKWRPGGNKPYLEVLLSLSKIPDSVITFDKILNLVPDQRKPGIKAVKQRIAEVIHDPYKGVDLRKQIAFDSDCFSMEDPDPNELYRSLGIEPESLEASRAYSYDVGFSFSGEARQIVEAVNQSLKDEDVVTFYDYDQQAFLLALDLEETLARIYSKSCRYYLVFLDKHYAKKVWTRFEREIMTGTGRSNHIIPAVLDDEGASGIVALSNTLGRIDLREVWKAISSKKVVDRDALNAIRNRCVLPLLQKIDVADLHSIP